MGELTIGEVASHTGVATSGLRYWEEIGPLPPPARVSGQRRYPPSAIERVGEILLLQDVGFTLREPHRRKLAELDRRLARIEAARTAIAHGLACPHEDIRTCPSFARVVETRPAEGVLKEAPSPAEGRGPGSGSGLTR
ncbi:MerR family transcriptional regulator [Amycolatopsis speibonae]|uniref:MerR family transcriptional regulator n=1 Tax=Amycolatopsis speibonae TaxID=1450224 RepID=A0ABV7PCK7_9PSEU